LFNFADYCLYHLLSRLRSFIVKWEDRHFAARVLAIPCCRPGGLAMVFRKASALALLGMLFPEAAAGQPRTSAQPAQAPDEAVASAGGPAKPAAWRAILADRLATFGHRNWIAIVDSAYPAQTSPGVETIVTRAGHLEVVAAVLKQVTRARHVTPRVYLDAELEHVPPADAPGVQGYRVALAKLLADAGKPPQSPPADSPDASPAAPPAASAAQPIRPLRLPHAEIIDKLDAAGAKFRVLVLKTNLAVPYSSVFIELDCGYWTPAAEKRLREKMTAQPQ